MSESMLPPLIGVLKGEIGNFAAKMGEAKAIAAETSGFTSTAFSGLATIGAGAFLAVGGAAVVGGGMALKMAGDFQESMTALVTGAGESKSNIDMVSKGILDMAGQVGVSADKLAKGMYMIESAGYHGADGLNVLKVAAQGAKVGNADMATVADALTSALNAYHLPASQATSVTNDLIATVASGKMHMQDLAGALGTVLPAASTAHISLAEVTGAIATMTMQGTPAADAATYLRQTILQLENPSHKAQKALADVGLSSHQLANDLGSKGLAATLQEATDAISKKFTPGSAEYIAHLADMVGGTKSMQAALELTGSNMDVFKANVAGINGAVKEGGKEVRGWAEVQGDFNHKVEAAKDRLGAMGITLGTALIPYAERAMDLTARFADYLSKNKVAAEIFAVAIGGPLLVAIAAYTVSMISAAVATVAATWPILLIIAAVAALAVGAILVYNNWGRISAFFSGELHAALAKVGEIVHSVGNAFSAFGTAVQARVQAVLRWVGDNWPLIVGIVTGPIGLLVGEVIQHWGQIKATIAGAITAVHDTILHGVQAAVTWFVDKMGWSRDMVPQTLGQIPQLAGDIFGLLKDGVVGKLTEMGNAMVDLLWRPVRLAEAALHWLYDHNYYVKDLVDFIVRVFQNLQGEVRATWNAITGFFTQTWDRIRAVATAAWSGMVDVIVKQNQRNHEAIVRIWTEITTWIHEQWERLSAAASALWSGISNVIGQKAQAASDELARIWGAITDWLSQQWNSLSGAASSAWSGVVSAISGALSFVWDAVTSPIGRAVDWLKGLADDAWSWGANMVNQFIGGITSAAGGVGNAISGIAGSIAGMLGFHSPPPDGPAADSDTWMPNFVGMLVGGLEDGHGAVRSAAAGLAGGLRVSGSSSSSAGAGITSSGPGVGAGTSGGHISTEGMEGRLDVVIELLSRILSSGNVANPAALVAAAVSRAQRQSATGIRMATL